LSQWLNTVPTGLGHQRHTAFTSVPNDLCQGKKGTEHSLRLKSKTVDRVRL